MIKIKEKNFITAILYIHNCEKNLNEFLSNLCGTLEENFEKYEIICVNDFSTDRSIEKIKNFVKNTKKSISLLNMSYYQGIELSMNAGMDLSIGDFVLEFDSIYFETDSLNQMIMQVYFKSLEGNDIVSAAPDKTKNTTSKFFYSIFNKHSYTSNNLRTETFRILSRRAINRVQSMNITVPYRKAVYANCGLKYDTVLYTNKINKKQKYDQGINDIRKNLAIDSFILFTNITYKIAIGFSFLMMMVTFGTAAYTFAVFFSNEKPIEGWTTTMLFLSFAFFGLFAILAVIIKYLTIVLNISFKKTRYIIESIEKITG